MWLLTPSVSHYWSISVHQCHRWRCLTWLIYNSWIKVKIFQLWLVYWTCEWFVECRGCFKSFFKCLSSMLFSYQLLYYRMNVVLFAAVWLQMDFILFGVKQQLHQKLESPSCGPNRFPVDWFNLWFKLSEFIYLNFCTWTGDDVKS